MTATVGFDELLAYSDHERNRWREWIAADPTRLAVAFQAEGGRFPTIGSLFDHIFLVERRHLSRLQGAVPPEATGVPAGDWTALFEYAGLVRDELRKCIADLNDVRAGESISFVVASGPLTMTKRWLAVHILLHEVRHLAQIAYAARRAGLEPPGQHDIAFFTQP